MASPQAEPLFQILVDNEIELEAEIPSIHVPKLKTGEIARISIAGGAERVGRVRLVAPDIDQKSQLGKVRLAVGQRCVAPDRHVRPRHHRRQAQLRRRDPAHRRRLPGRGHQRAGGPRQHRRDAAGASSDCLSDDSIEIREGLNDGEIVVADAGTSLHDGDKIKTMFADEFDQPRVR